MLLKENDVAKANNTVRSEEISSEIWFIALSYPSLSSLLGRAARRGVASTTPFPPIHSQLHKPRVQHLSLQVADRVFKDGKVRIGKRIDAVL